MRSHVQGYPLYFLLPQQVVIGRWEGLIDTSRTHTGGRVVSVFAQHSSRRESQLDLNDIF